MATTIYWVDEDSGETRTVQFDVVEASTGEDLLTVTQHPVETGANIVDHARREPETLMIEGIVSNTPMPGQPGVETIPEELDLEVVGDPGTQQVTLDIPQPRIQPSVSGLVRAGIAALSQSGALKATLRGNLRKRRETIRASFSQRTTPTNRIREVYESLLEAQEKRALIVVQTRDREYYDMILERVAAPRTVQDGAAARFQIDLRRIRLATSETVEAPRPVEARGALSKAKGAQATKKKDETPQLRSTLDRLLF